MKMDKLLEADILECRDKIYHTLKSELQKKLTIDQAIFYSCTNIGKCIRGFLVYNYAKLFNKEDNFNEKDTLSIASSFELIHSFSLIHDDLPSMDDSAERRGKPSCHVVFGEGMSVLAGTLTLLKAQSKIYNTQPKIIPIMLKAASEIITGQSIDISNEALSSVDDVLNMFSLKTASLFASCCSSGAILGGANQEQINISAKYGEYLGIAYQILDDLKDQDGPLLKLLPSSKAVLLLKQFAKKATLLSEKLGCQNSKKLISYIEHQSLRYQQS